MSGGEGGSASALVGARAAEVADAIDAAFDRLLALPDDPRRRLYDAMRHAAIGGGKRLRPLLVQAASDLSPPGRWTLEGFMNGPWRHAAVARSAGAPARFDNFTGMCACGTKLLNVTDEQHARQIEIEELTSWHARNHTPIAIELPR